MNTNSSIRDLLIVDDDQPIRTLICLAMTRGGLACDVAHDGEDALRQLETSTYRVILLDLMMPNVDGAEFLKRMTGLPLAMASRPVVLLMTASAIDKPPLVGEAVHAMVRKPFDMNDLVALVCGCVEHRLAHEKSKVAG